MKPTQLAAGALVLAELTKSAFVTPPSLTGEVKTGPAAGNTVIRDTTPNIVAEDRIKNHIEHPRSDGTLRKHLLGMIRQNRRDVADSLMQLPSSVAQYSPSQASDFADVAPVGLSPRRVIFGK